MPSTFDDRAQKRNGLKSTPLFFQRPPAQRNYVEYISSTSYLIATAQGTFSSIGGDSYQSYIIVALIY